MSEKITEGFVAALGGGISGLVFAAVVKAVLAPYNALIEIVNIIQSLAGLESMDYWGILYMIGWLTANGLLSKIGIVDGL